MGTLHCALENGADLYVNERQKIRNYCAMSAEERKRRRRMPNCGYFFFTQWLWKLVLYSDVIHSFDWKSAIEHDGGVLNA